jgi:hypothetical protein
MPRRIVLFLWLCSSLVACTSLLGDIMVSTQSSDAGSVSESGVADAVVASEDAAPMVTAVASNGTVYLGQMAAVDASKSATTQGSLSFTWTLMAAPLGSRVSTSSLMGTSTATVSFVPDVVGDYTLSVSVRALAASATASPIVTVVAPQVLFAQGALNGSHLGGTNQGQAFYSIADIDGGNAHPVLCPEAVSNSSNQPSLAPFAAYAGRAYDYWEAPPGQASRFAALTVDDIPDAGLSTRLWTGTTRAKCGADSGDLVELWPVGSVIGPPFGSEPHFSPDGTRFVIFDRAWRIVTYASDGTEYHVVATYPLPYQKAASFLDPVGFDAGASYVLEPPRVVWTANGLAWAQPTAGGWEIVTAPDKANATLTTYMTCTGITPREIAMLTDGTVIASYRPALWSSENLYQLKPVAQQHCSHERQYTSLPDAGSSTATDFAVSPDGTLIAFLQIDTSSQDVSPWRQGGVQLPGGYLYVVPVAGGTPKQVSSEPVLYGPRWIGGGTALVFTRLDGVPPSTGMPASSVVVIATDGGGLQVVAQGDGVNTFVSTSGNGACAVGGAPGAPTDGSRGRGAAAFALLAMACCCARKRSRGHLGRPTDVFVSSALSLRSSMRHDASVDAAEQQSDGNLGSCARSGASYGQQSPGPVEWKALSFRRGRRRAAWQGTCTQNLRPLHDARDWESG